MDDDKLTWEIVSEYNQPITRRAVVPGGWLYCIFSGGVSMVFVPNPPRITAGSEGLPMLNDVMAQRKDELPVLQS